MDKHLIDDIDYDFLDLYTEFNTVPFIKTYCKSLFGFIYAIFCRKSKV